MPRKRGHLRDNLYLATRCSSVVNEVRTSSSSRAVPHRLSCVAALGANSIGRLTRNCGSRYSFSTVYWELTQFRGHMVYAARALDGAAVCSAVDCDTAVWHVGVLRCTDVRCGQKRSADDTSNSGEYVVSRLSSCIMATESSRNAGNDVRVPRNAIILVPAAFSRLRLERYETVPLRLHVQYTRHEILASILRMTLLMFVPAVKPCCVPTTSWRTSSCSRSIR